MQQFESVNLEIIYLFYVFPGYVGNVNFCKHSPPFFVSNKKVCDSRSYINDVNTVFVNPLAAHAPITVHQSYFQFEICGIINRPLKSSHSQWVPITCQRYIHFHLLTSGQ